MSPGHSKNSGNKKGDSNNIGTMANDHAWTPKSSTVIEFVEPLKLIKDPYKNNEIHNESRHDSNISESNKVS